MPLHQNQDGTWQWGKSGKRYKKKEDAIKQMKAIFASGYKEGQSKQASYVEALNLIKQAAPNMKQIAARQRALAQINHTFPSIPKPDEAPYNRLSPEGYKRALDRIQAKAKQKFSPTVKVPYSTTPGSYNQNLFQAQLNALGQVESSDNPYAVSKDGGAVGGFQIRQPALKELKRRKLIDQKVTREDLLKDPKLSRRVAGLYWGLVSKGKSPKVAYARYFHGPNDYTNALKKGTIPESTTEEQYAATVPRTGLYQSYYNHEKGNIPSQSK